MDNMTEFDISQSKNELNQNEFHQGENDAKQEKKKQIIFLIIGLVATAVSGIVVLLLNNYVIPLIPIIPRIFLIILFYWIMAIVPIVLLRIQKVSLKELGFSKEKIGLQILFGLALAVVWTLVMIILPSILNWWKSSTSYTQLWQFAFELVYLTIGVATVEEIVFRGFFHYTFLKLFKKEWVAIVLSALVFGASHLISGNLFSFVFTTCFGLSFGFARYKFKHCTTASLIIAHGLYDFMNTLWPFLAVLLGILK